MIVDYHVSTLFGQAQRYGAPEPLGRGRLPAQGEIGGLDRYAVLDPSFRLIRDAQTKRSAETAEYYEYLRSQTLVAPRAWRSPTIDFVDGLGRAGVRPPHIFLFIVDSLRRDYVSAYNPAVTFTPEIARLAADSFVFDRAFTRYAGTALAVASFWSGGMTIHTLDQTDFTRHNTLLKLLDANGYIRMMDFDSVVSELVPNDALASKMPALMASAVPAAPTAASAPTLSVPPLTVVPP